MNMTTIGVLLALAISISLFVWIIILQSRTTLYANTIAEKTSGAGVTISDLNYQTITPVTYSTIASFPSAAATPLAIIGLATPPSLWISNGTSWKGFQTFGAYSAFASRDSYLVPGADARISLAFSDYDVVGNPIIAYNSFSGGSGITSDLTAGTFQVAVTGDYRVDIRISGSWTEAVTGDGSLRIAVIGESAVAESYPSSTSNYYSQQFAPVQAVDTPQDFAGIMQVHLIAEENYRISIAQITIDGVYTATNLDMLITPISSIS